MTTIISSFVNFVHSRLQLFTKPSSQSFQLLLYFVSHRRDPFVFPQAEPKVRPVCAAGVWLPSGTRDTWRRRWKGWCSCSSAPSLSRSHRTSPSRREYGRWPSWRCILQSATSTRWIRSRSSVTSSQRHQWRHDSVASCCVHDWTR